MYVFYGPVHYSRGLLFSHIENFAHCVIFALMIKLDKIYDKYKLLSVKQMKGTLYD